MLNSMHGLEHERSAPEQLTADPGELAQQLKSQLLPGDKALSKNQRKKARKKVSKLLHKTLGLPRTSSDVNAPASPENGSALIMSEDTGCSGRHPGGRTSDPPACTSARLAGGTAPHPPPSTSLHAPIQRVMARAPGPGELPSPPPPKRRRVQNDGSLASGLGTAPTRSQHTTSRNLEGGSAAAAAGPSSGGGGGGCSSSQLSRGAQKRLSRRQAQPEDLLTTDDGDGGGSGGMDGTASGAVAGARSSGGDGTGGVAHAGRRKRDREQQHQRVKQRVQEGPGSRRRGKGGQAAVAVAGSSMATGASEEVVQRPQTVGTAASAAAAAVAAVHRVGGGSGYAMYGGVLAAAAAAPTRPLLGLALAGGSAAGAGGGGAAAAAAARGPVDFSAALLLMRVQLRSSAVATLSSGGEGTAGGAGESMLDTDSAAGTAIGAGGSGVAAVTVAAAAMTSPGSLGPEEGIQTKTQPKPKQGRGPEGQAGARQPAPERAALNRYGNYHRYYGYRLGSDLDKDPRVKLMKPEWFQQRVCVDVGCNEGLVTLAVAARFGAKRMTGYDIDGTLIKKACKNLRVMRSEYTARLQALSRGGAGAGMDALGVGGAGQGEDNEVPSVGAADGDDADGGQHSYADDEPHGEQSDVVGPSDAGGDNTADEPHGDQDMSDGDSDGDGDGNEGLAGAEREEGARGANRGEDVLRHGGEGDGGPTAPAAIGRPVRPRPVAASAATPRGPPLAAGPPPLHVGLLRSFVRSLAGTRFMQQDWANARGRPESADTIMCLSVTKWVHLNKGDEGLKRLFKKLFDTLTPGGLLVLEPQPWKSYKRAVHKTTTNAVPFKRIEQLQLRPQHFAGYLTNVVGFVLEAQLHEGGGAGFDRPLFLLRKPAATNNLMTPAGTCSHHV